MLFGGITIVSAILAAALCICNSSFADWSWLAVMAGSFLGIFFGLTVLALLFLVLVCALVDTAKPQEHDSPFYRRVMHLYIEALMNLALVRLHTEGLEKTPEEGRFLLVCNHLFVADPGILLHCFPKSQLAFISKRENMELPIVNKFLHKTMCQMLDRENDRQALKVILKCIQLLRDGEVSVGVFPEGYTSKDGKLHHFRSGVFKIAQKANVPIVICTIQGTREIFRNLKKLRPTDIHLHLVHVIPAEDLKGMSTVQISEKVYDMMLLDLGGEFRLNEAQNT